MADSRVSLDSVVLAFQQGLAPETIAAECFPTLTLEQVYGAITYYLAHRPEIDTYLQHTEREFEAFHEATHNADPPFSDKLAQARRHMQVNAIYSLPT